MANRIAVLIDGENISHRLYPQIHGHLQQQGEIAILRVYADWSLPNVSGWKPVALQNGIKAVNQFQIGKNSTDSVLIMDAIELLHQQADIDTFCIVSSDSDYCTLCQRLRDRGKTVLGFGSEQSSQELRKYCTSFQVLVPAGKCLPNHSGSHAAAHNRMHIDASPDVKRQQPAASGG